MSEDIETSHRILMLGTLVWIRSMRGQPTGDLIAELTAHIGTATDPILLASLYTATAYEAFGTGRLADARAAWNRLAEISSTNMSDSMERRARAALWLGDVEAVRADLAAIDEAGVHGPAVETGRATIRAGIAAVEGRPADALALYRDALREWRDLGLVWDEALCGIDMAILLDPGEPEVRAAAEAARETLVRLEAAPFLARLDAAMARPGKAGYPIDAFA